MIGKIFHILKKNNIIIFLLSIIFAIIFTIISPHWYVKSDYWKNVYYCPLYGNLNIELQEDNDSIQKLFKIKNIILTNEGNITDYDDNIITYAIKSSYDYTTTHIKLKSKINSLIKISYDNNYYYPKIGYKSIMINNREYINELDDENSFVISIKKDEEIDISIISKLNIKPRNFINSINLYALCFTVFFYFIFLYVILVRLNIIRIKSLLKKIKIKIIENKTTLLIFLFFFGFYWGLNYYAATHIDYFAGEHPIIGPNPRLIANILFSETYRFHAFAILPFYPLFDFVYIITKNIYCSVLFLYIFVLSLTVCFIYKILENINKKNQIINMLITSIFGFSWICILFSYAYSYYIFTAFYMSLLLFIIIKELNSTKKSNIRILLIGIFLAFSFGVTHTNIISIFILLTIFLFSKKYIKNLFIILLTFIVCSITCIILKDLVSDGGATKALFAKNTKQEINTWINFDMKNNYNNLKRETLYKLVVIDNELFGKIFLYSWLLVILLGLFLSILKRNKFNKEDVIFFYIVLCALIYNLITNFYWNSEQSYLYMLNHLVLWFVIFGNALKLIDISLGKYNCILKNKLIYILFLLFITYQLYNNYNFNKQIQNEALKKYPLEYNLNEIINKND